MQNSSLFELWITFESISLLSNSGTKIGGYRSIGFSVYFIIPLSARMTSKGIFQMENKFENVWS